MFFKLAMRNSRRSRKENGLFFASLVVSIVAFYIILALSHQDVMIFLRSLESDAVNSLLQIAAVFYVFSLVMLFFLIYYASKYQLERRRHELGMYIMMGMRRSKLFALLIEEDLEVEKLPQIWNDKYEEYLGVRPSTDREGVLQDIHWSQGSIGYFPSYALGNAFGAQIYHQMKKELPVEKLLEAGNLGEIREYLRKNIHQYGKLKDSRQILRDMTGEDFNPSYYVAYLEEKYGRPEKVQ